MSLELKENKEKLTEEVEKEVIRNLFLLQLKQKWERGYIKEFLWMTSTCGMEFRFDDRPWIVAYTNKLFEGQSRDPTTNAREIFHQVKKVFCLVTNKRFMIFLRGAKGVGVYWVQ